MSHKIVVWCCLLLLPAPGWANITLEAELGSSGVYEPIDSPDPLGGTVISGVPAYHWWRGCGPTAAGMVMGYWDMHGFSRLIPGNSSTQTDAVNQAIASDGHYNDYVLPMDDTGARLRDKSEDPPGSCHPDNCLADFTGTSRSELGLQYGWSSFEGVWVGLERYVGYVNDIYGTEYEVSTRADYPVSGLMPSQTLTWTGLVGDIKRNRPFVLLVDSNADGNTDHFVTAIGYRVNNGIQEYGCLDTWSTDQIRWEPFQSMGAGQEFGIYGAIHFAITPEPGSLLLLLSCLLFVRRR